MATADKQITATFLERSNLKEGQVVWRGDPGCPGLRVRLSHSRTRGRSVSWYYRYKLNGKLQAPMAFGEYPAMNHEQARNRVQTVLRPLARAGQDVKRELRRNKAQESAQEVQTMQGLIASYLDYCNLRGLSEGTLKSYRRYLRPVANWWADRKPSEINRGDVQDIFHRVMGEGVPPFDIDGSEMKGGRVTGGARAAGLTHSAGRGFWTWLVDREFAEYNPWKEQKQLSEMGQSGIAERVLTDDEIKQVLANNSLSLRDNTILRFMLGTGLRPNEVCGATWSEIDLSEGIWMIPKGRMKYKKLGHVVALSDFVVEALKRWKRTQRGKPRYVFPASGSRFDHVVPDNLVERFKRLGLEGFTPKVCRSSFRTGMQRIGCPKEVRSYMSHHQQADKVSKAYDKYDYFPEARQWWQKWGEHLEGRL